MFKMKYFVLATLICVSTFAAQEKNKKNFVQRHKVLTGVGVTVGAFVAYSLYSQKHLNKSLTEKLVSTALDAAIVIEDACKAVSEKASKVKLFKRFFPKKTVSFGSMGTNISSGPSSDTMQAFVTPTNTEDTCYLS